MFGSGAGLGSVKSRSWTAGTLFSWDKQITAVPLHCYHFKPVNKRLNNLLSGWLTDTQLPRGSRLCFVFSGPAHHSTSTALAFSLHRSFSFFPSVPQPCPVFSFQNKSFSSLWLILLFLDYFFTPLVLSLSDFSLLSPFAIAPYSNCSRHVILALRVILGLYRRVTIVTDVQSAWEHKMWAWSFRKPFFPEGSRVSI